MMGESEKIILQEIKKLDMTWKKHYQLIMEQHLRLDRRLNELYTRVEVLEGNDFNKKRYFVTKN